MFTNADGLKTALNKRDLVSSPSASTIFQPIRYNVTRPRLVIAAIFGCTWRRE